MAKPRAEEMLEEYLDEMPEDIRALMRGDPGAHARRPGRRVSQHAIDRIDRL